MEEIAPRLTSKRQFLPLETPHQEFCQTDACEQILLSCFSPVVPAFGEWCVVELCTEDETLREPWVFHQGAAAPLSQQNFRTLLSLNHLWQETRAVRASCLDDSFLHHIARDSEHLKWLQNLNVTEYLSAPLISAHHVWGWATVFTSQPPPQEARSDLSKFQAFASCAAAALDIGVVKHRAEQMYEMKNRFVSMISHELRAPLNITLGWSALLLDNQELDEETKRTVEIIYRNTREQADIITNLLDSTRIDLGKLTLDLKDIHLATFVEQDLQGLCVLAREKGVHLKACIQAPFAKITADPIRLRQILQNLVVNAIKFTPRDGSVTVQVEEDIQHVTLKVVDTGEGISKDFLPHVFDKFKQRLGKTTYQPGLGLGLSIVRDLVQAHGADVSAESDGPQCGAIFTIRFPKHTITHHPSAMPNLELVH